MRKIKIMCLLIFTGLAIFGLAGNKRFIQSATAFIAGPPAAHTGAPGEQTCNVCHTPNEGNGQFTIVAPASYTPGQTYQIMVRHQTTDQSRRRWGFQLTSLAGTTFAGTLSNVNNSAQVINGGNGRFYIEHTQFGTFGGQANGAQWTFNWTAPATNVGAVTFYAAGNQANNDGFPEGDQIYTTTAVSQAPAPPVTAPSFFDFDGDDKTDISIFRPSLGEWWYLRSTDGGNAAAQFGNGMDTIVPGDYTGDGKTDIAIWRPSTGEWFVLRSEDQSFYSFPFGTGGDIPAPADFDGDGKTDAAVFRPSNSTWFIFRSTGGTTIQQFGSPGDAPVPADYDGDAKADIAIYRPSLAEWWIQRSNLGLIAFQFGASGDKTAPGDFTGDSKADVAFWRPADGFWFVLRSEDFSFFSFPFGASGDVPAPGDYDGDGKFDAGVFRPSNTTWFVQRSTAGTLIQTFGVAGDVPVPNAFVR